MSHDTDSRLLAEHPNVTTVLAANLNAAMRHNVTALAAYMTLYGVDWSPLGNGATVSDVRSTTLATAF